MVRDGDATRSTLLIDLRGVLTHVRKAMYGGGTRGVVRHRQREGLGLHPATRGKQVNLVHFRQDRKAAQCHASGGPIFARRGAGRLPTPYQYFVMQLELDRARLLDDVSAAACPDFLHGPRRALAPNLNILST